MSDFIQNELIAFKQFKETYSFQFKEISEENGRLYCDGISITDENGVLTPVCDKWINVGYNIKNPLSKALSNLFPYTFMFQGKELSSIESFFQGIKFRDAYVQSYLFSYSGTDAVNIQSANNRRWQDDGLLYWQGEAFERTSSRYIDLIDELYISAIQNPLYRQALKNADRYILHSIGKTNQNETVFTRYEFEKELNCLSAFLKCSDEAVQAKMLDKSILF